MSWGRSWRSVLGGLGGAGQRQGLGWEGPGLPQWTEGWCDLVPGCREQGWGAGGEEGRGKQGDRNEAVEAIPGERGQGWDQGRRGPGWEFRDRVGSAAEVQKVG